MKRGDGGTILTRTAYSRSAAVNGYGYTLNDKDQRTQLTLPDDTTWDYAYDDLGQVTGGVKKDDTETELANHAYTYDTIGNRESASIGTVETAYTANDLNQYTAIDTVNPTYDADGNLLTGYGDWTMEWNGENRLKSMFNATTKLEFSYDYLGRRFRKKVYTKDGTTWTYGNR